MEKEKKYKKIKPPTARKLVADVFADEIPPEVVEVLTPIAHVLTEGKVNPVQLLVAITYFVDDWEVKLPKTEANEVLSGLIIGSRSFTNKFDV